MLALHGKHHGNEQELLPEVFRRGGSHRTRATKIFLCGIDEQLLN